MGDVHIAFNDDEFGLDIDIEEIDAETDFETLCDWYSRAEALADEIKDSVEYSRFIEKATDAWLWRAGRKIAYLKRGVRCIEQRILKLGGMPPYRLDDGRANHIRILEKKLGQAKEVLLSNGLPLPWERRLAQGMSAGTAETAPQAQGEARQPGPKDAPNPSTPSPTTAGDEP